ncbi:transmembrane protein 14C-like [Watersipora subatra]|uniref:transmembrane protein 14C-like n=1 Tax=Watersipora subatra TaxID=2589382 RepID=UPI00355B1AEE
MDVIHLLYGSLVAAGGVFGYAKSGSTASLTAGLISGGLITLGTYLASTGKDTLGQALVAFTALGLTFAMGKRYMNSHKMMPAGIVTIISVLILLRMIYEQFLK